MGHEAAANGPDLSGRRRLSVALSGFGPFVSVEAHAPQEEPVAPWRPLDELVDRPETFDARVDQVRDALRERADRVVDRRVAGSVAHLGIVARVLTPWIAAAALKIDRPMFRIEELWWQDVAGGAVPLSVVETGESWPADTSRPLDGSAVERLTRTALDRHHLGPRVAWGNVASAANGAATVIGAHRSDLAAPARSAADMVLGDARLDGGGLRSGPGFRRRSCCLIYRVSDSRAGVCGDCVLSGPRAAAPTDEHD